MYMVREGADNNVTAEQQVEAGRGALDFTAGRLTAERGSPSVLLTVSIRMLYSWILSLWCWNSLFRLDNSSSENFPEVLAWRRNSHDLWNQFKKERKKKRKAKNVLCIVLTFC